MLREQVCWDKSNAMPEEKERFIKEALLPYNHVFALDEQKLGRTGIAKFKIQTSDGPPVNLPPHRLSPANRLAVQREVVKLEEMGLIVKASGDWASPIVVV